MINKFVTVFFAFILLTASTFNIPCAYADVTDKQWDQLLSSLNEEDWTKGYEYSSKYLKEMPDTDKRLPRLRYILLYTAAGKVSEGKMTYDDLEQAIKPMIGKYVVFPYRAIAADTQGSPLNLITGHKDDKKRLFSVASNQDGTTIHAFEYVTLKDEFDVQSHDGQPASIRGIIEKIEPNPNKSLALVLRVYIADGEVEVKDIKDFKPTHKSNGSQTSRSQSP